MASCGGVSRSSAAADCSRRRAAGGPSAAETLASAPTESERRELEHGVAQRTTVGACIAGLVLRFIRVAGEQRRQREREPQPNAIGRGLCGQLGQRDLKPAARVLVAAKPPLLVGQRDGERQSLAGRGGLQGVKQRPAGGGGIAGGRLGVGEQPL